MPERVKTITILVPVLNEEDSIAYFLDTVRNIIRNEPYQWKFLFVDDGSTDATLSILRTLNKTDNSIGFLSLSRNFGKETAMAAGLRHAKGDAVIIMDVDLQDPPELIPQFLRKWEAGHASVAGFRKSRSSDSFLKRTTAAGFYRVFNIFSKVKITPNTGDYRLLDRRVVEALNLLPERVRFTKGLYAWVGFDEATVDFVRPERAKGQTKWNSWKLWNFAIDGISAFSSFPMRIWAYIGFLVAASSFIYAAYTFLKTLFFGVDVPGYSSLLISILGLGGCILMSLGIIGEYLGRIYEEVKLRPMYLLKEQGGVEENARTMHVEATTTPLGHTPTEHRN